jgi:hypothetical protein
LEGRAGLAVGKDIWYFKFLLWHSNNIFFVLEKNLDFATVQRCRETS